MRRRLEKWSQGWVTPANCQPQQRTGAPIDGFNKGSLSSEAAGHAASQTSVPMASSSQDAVFHCTEPTFRAEAEAPVRVVQAMYCLYPAKMWANQEDSQHVEPSFLPCSIQMSKEALHLQSDFKKMAAFQERLAQRHAAFKRGAEVGDLQRLRDFAEELWRQEHEEKLWRRRGVIEDAMEVDGLEMDAMLLEDLMSKLPSLRTALISVDSRDQLDAVREIRRMWSQCSGESSGFSSAIRISVSIFGDIPKCLVKLARVQDLLCEVRVEALAALADLASSEKGAMVVAEIGALPLCVSLLQSSEEEIREGAFRVLHSVHEKGEVMSIHLNKVTDVALLEGQAEEADSSAIPLWLSAPSVSRKPEPASEDTDLSELLLWDLPPIPFGQLPTCEPSLPSRWQVPQKVPAGRWVQGRPLGDFDRSNIQLDDLISLGLLPLHPCMGRLPLPSPVARSEQEGYVVDTCAWVQRAKQSTPPEMKSLLVIWVGTSVEMARSSGRGCRLRQQGVPTILACSGATEASQQRKEILRRRAEVLGL
eukprot:s3579_g10.t1